MPKLCMLYICGDAFLIIIDKLYYEIMEWSFISIGANSPHAFQIMMLP